jgi:glycosyltransferase involved in cell wall biosynthesis
LKILHVATTLGPRNGGAAVACIELCKSLAERGHEVEIFTTDIDMPPDWGAAVDRPSQHGKLRVSFFATIGTEYYWVSPKLAFALWRRVREFDVVHIHSLYRFHLPLTSWICRYFQRPYVVKPHGSLDPFLFKHRRWRKLPHERLFDRPSYAHAAAIHYVADDERLLAETTALVQGLKTIGVVVPSAVVVPEGTSLAAAHPDDTNIENAQRFIERFPELKGKRVVLFLGRLNFKKGLDILVEAFSILHDEQPDTHLLLVGPDTDGYASQIRGWLHKHEVERYATFTGMLHGAEKLAAFQVARVFVLPSYTENFGIAIIEAMTQGCPVVISNKVNIWREIEQANAGLVTECDAMQTAKAIGKILDDAELANNLVKNGRRLATEHFTWPVAAEKMEKAYQSILANVKRVS